MESVAYQAKYADHLFEKFRAYADRKIQKLCQKPAGDNTLWNHGWLHPACERNRYIWKCCSDRHFDNFPDTHKPTTRNCDWSDLNASKLY